MLIQGSLSQPEPTLLTKKGHVDFYFDGSPAHKGLRENKRDLGFLTPPSTTKNRQKRISKLEESPIVEPSYSQ